MFDHTKLLDEYIYILAVSWNMSYVIWANVYDTNNDTWNPDILL